MELYFCEIQNKPPLCPNRDGSMDNIHVQRHDRLITCVGILSNQAGDVFHYLLECDILFFNWQ